MRDLTDEQIQEDLDAPKPGGDGLKRLGEEMKRVGEAAERGSKAFADFFQRVNESAGAERKAVAATKYHSVACRCGAACAVPATAVGQRFQCHACGHVNDPANASTPIGGNRRSRRARAALARRAR
jgi:hypothetical protein